MRIFFNSYLTVKGIGRSPFLPFYIFIAHPLIYLFLFSADLTSFLIYSSVYFTGVVIFTIVIGLGLMLPVLEVCLILIAVRSFVNLEMNPRTKKRLSVFLLIVFSVILILSMILTARITNQEFASFEKLWGSFTEYIRASLLVMVMNMPLFGVLIILLLIKTYLSLESPDTLMLKIADVLPKKLREILRQEARDMMIEYEEAILLGKYFRAKVIVFYYHAGVIWSAVKWVAERIQELIRFTPKMN